MKTPSKNLPGKKELARQFADSFNASVPASERITQEQAAKLISVMINVFGAAIVKEGGFELRGFATMRVKQTAPHKKINPRTGQVIRDEEGHPVYYSRRAVRVRLSSLIEESLNA